MREKPEVETAYRGLSIPYKGEANHVEASNAPIDWPEFIIFIAGGIATYTVMIVGINLAYGDPPFFGLLF